MKVENFYLAVLPKQSTVDLKKVFGLKEAKIIYNPENLSISKLEELKISNIPIIFVFESASNHDFNFLRSICIKKYNAKIDEATHDFKELIEKIQNKTGSYIKEGSIVFFLSGNPKKEENEPENKWNEAKQALLNILCDENKNLRIENDDLRTKLKVAKLGNTHFFKEKLETDSDIIELKKKLNDECLKNIQIIAKKNGNDTKEMFEFAEWASYNYQYFSGRWIGSNREFTTKQLYEIFKS